MQFADELAEVALIIYIFICIVNLDGLNILSQAQICIHSLDVQH